MTAHDKDQLLALTLSRRLGVTIPHAAIEYALALQAEFDQYNEEGK